MAKYRPFRRHDARDYALKWALRRNPENPDFSGRRGGGGDCANFVSQSLYAGGCPRDPRDWWAGQSSATIAWNRASHLRHHISTLLWATRCDRNELWLGDIVFGLIDGDVVHAMIVTDVKAPRPGSRHQVYICGHTTDRLNYDLENVDSFYGAKNVEYWSMANNVRAYTYG